MFFQPLLVQFHFLEVLPDAGVTGAAISATNAGAVFIHSAEAALLVAMDAMAVFSVADVVRAAQVPPHFTGFDFLNGEGKIELAADGMADVHALGAIYLYFRLLAGLGPIHAQRQTRSCRLTSGD